MFEFVGGAVGNGGEKGGDGGGKIVAIGTPEQVAATKGSFTGEFLKPLVRKNSKTRRNEAVGA